MRSLITAPFRVDPRPPTDAPEPAELPRRVAAALAHNVNNALSGVISYLELALREAEPGTPLHAHLSEALRCAWRGAERVHRVAAFARGAGSGRDTAARQPHLTSAGEQGTTARLSLPPSEEADDVSSTPAASAV